MDPLGELNRQWSTYSYAYNNPIRFTDPDGMLPDGFLPEDRDRGDFDIVPGFKPEKDASKDWWTEEMDPNIPKYIGKDGKGDGKSKKGDGELKKENVRNISPSELGLSFIGVALVKVGDKLHSACVTSTGKIIVLPTDKAYNLFVGSGQYQSLKGLSSSSTLAGNILKGLGTAGTIVNIMIDAHAWENGQISTERFGYRATGNVLSLGTAIIIGGNPGTWAGVGISALFYAGEATYDYAIRPALWHTAGKIVEFESFVKNRAINQKMKVIR